MKITNKLAINYLKYNKNKVLIVFLSIVLSTTLLFSLSLGASTLRQNKIDKAIESKGSYHVIFKNINIGNKNIENDDKIKSVLIIQEVDNISSDEIKEYKNIDTLLEAEGGAFSLIIKSVNDDFKCNISLVRGKYPNSNKEIIISNRFATIGNFNIGDQIKDYKIVGIYGDTKLGFIDYAVNKNDYVNPIFRPLAITNDNTKENLISDYVVTYESNINLYSKIYEDADNFGLKYENRYGTRYYENVDINTELLTAYGQYSDGKKQISSYLYLIIVLTVISVFCIIAIHNAFSLSYLERKKHFGVLRSLGASKKQIIKMLFFETLILSGLSIPVGILFGFGVTNVFIFIINKMLENVILADYKMVIYPSFLVVSLIFILVTIIISAVIPAIKSSNTPAIVAIKENKKFKIDKSKENYPLIAKVFGHSGEIAYKNITRNKSKFKTTVISLTASIVLFISLSCYIDIIASQNLFDSGSEYDIDIYVESSTYQDSFLDEVKKIVKDNDSITVIKNQTFKYKNDINYLTDKAQNNIFVDNIGYIQILGLEESIYNKYKKNIKLNDDNKIILYNNVSEYNENTDSYSDYQWFNKSINSIEICNINSTNTIDECYYNFSNFYITTKKFNNVFHMPTIVLNMKQYNEFINNYAILFEKSDEIKYADAIHIGINSKKFVKIDHELKNLFEKYKDIDLEINYNSASMENYDTYMIITTIRFTLYAILGFIVVIALTNIINILNTNISLRETEFAVLRSVGLSKKGLNNMMKLESLFLGIKTLVYAIPISLIFVIAQMFLSKFLSENNKIMIEFPLNTYIISIVGILIIIFIMQKYSISKIKNKNIIDSVRRESI